MTRSEILRRLGVPRFRHQCIQCRRYVPKLVLVFDWHQKSADGQMLAIHTCSDCAERIEQQNRQRTKENATNRFGYERANAEYRASQERSSNFQYLAACERMRREMGMK